ncbi:MAG: patatin-like phospholipase family protein, partial [Rhodobiaceae bacterium]|nr:patatin-like phospholipase family protein [Rhodobiaceae bacterium]
MKTILSFDGGGVRGAISVAFLERIERILPAGGGLPLARCVDLAGGTSTGAIIAGAISLGYSASDIKDFYLELAPRIFRRSRTRIPGLQAMFDARPLREELARVCGERTLESPDILTGFALVMKRMDTGSAWIVSNNPAGAFWNDPPDASYHGNRHYKLADLIRASTAAPHYFAPEPIDICAGEPPGLFVDGGVTPHNNPALALLQLVTIPAYGYGWATGEQDLRI